MIKDNLALVTKNIQDICKKCGRDPREIRLVAISKTYPPEVIRQAREAGIVDFGENRVQELIQKMYQLPDDIIWHMVGTIQTNKIKDLVYRVNWIHSISKSKYLKELEKRAKLADRHINVLIQVNISDEKQKSGCEPSGLAGILKFAATLKQVSVHGLMGMASFTDDRDLIRRQFRLLRTIRDEHLHYESDTICLRELSMGMSGDYDLAIEEGATIIRLGSILFGQRNYTAQDH